MTTPTTAERIDAALRVIAKWKAEYPKLVQPESWMANVIALGEEYTDARATIARLERELHILRAVVNKDMPVAAEHIGEILAENRALRTRADAAERRGEVMAKGLKAVEALINESHGVIGLHLNGDDAPWEDLRTGGGFEEWLREFDTALAAASGTTATTEG